MTLALLLFLVILYLSLNTSKKGNTRKTFVCIATFLMILISGLRHEAVGNDTYATMTEFEHTFYLSWNDVLSNFWLRFVSPDTTIGKDPGELIFYKTLSIFTKDTRVFLFVVAIITLISFGYFVYNNTDSLRAILFSYIYFVTLTYGFIPNSSFRQSIAFAVLLVAYMELKDKKIFKFLLLLLISSFFHKSALIAIVMLPMMFVKRCKIVYWLSLIPFIIFFFYYEPIGAFLGGFSDIYSAYATNQYYTQHSLPIMVILLVLGLYLYVGFSLRNDSLEENFRLYIYGTALTLVLVPLVRFDPSSLRLISYFAMLMGIQVGVSSERAKNNQVMFWIIIVVFLGKAALTYDDGYRFMWQQKRLHERYGMLQDPQTKTSKGDVYAPNVKTVLQEKLA